MDVYLKISNDDELSPALFNSSYSVFSESNFIQNIDGIDIENGILIKDIPFDADTITLYPYQSSSCMNNTYTSHILRPPNSIQMYKIGTNVLRVRLTLDITGLNATGIQGLSNTVLPDIGVSWVKYDGGDTDSYRPLGSGRGGINATPPVGSIYNNNRINFKIESYNQFTGVVGSGLIGSKINVQDNMSQTISNNSYIIGNIATIFFDITNQGINSTNFISIKLNTFEVRFNTPNGVKIVKYNSPSLGGGGPLINPSDERKNTYNAWDVFNGAIRPINTNII